MKTAINFLLVCAIVAAFTLLSRQLQKPTPIVVWDAGQYYAMARELAAAAKPYAESPYVFRIGVPWLVSKLSPRDPARGFFLINIVSAFAIAVLLAVWLRAWAIRGSISLLIVALFAAAWHGPVRYIYYNPGYVDPPFLALLIVGLLLIKSIAEDYSIAKVVALTFVSAAGVLVRETMLLVPMSFLLVNAPVKALRQDGRLRRAASTGSLIGPLVLSVCALAFTHAVVTVDATERSSMFGAAYQWLHKSPDSYLMGWFTAFGPMLAIVLFDWRRALRFLADHRWLAAFLAGCTTLAFFGGSDTERFAFWSMPVVYLLLADVVQQNADVFRSWYVIALLTFTQSIAARIFWGIPDPRAEQAVALAQSGNWTDKGYGVLNRLFVIDDFHWNLWSTFGSRPFRLLRIAWYVCVGVSLLLLMRRRTRALAGA